MSWESRLGGRGGGGGGGGGKKGRVRMQVDYAFSLGGFVLPFADAPPTNYTLHRVASVRIDVFRQTADWRPRKLGRSRRMAARVDRAGELSHHARQPLVSFCCVVRSRFTVFN